MISSDSKYEAANHLRIQIKTPFTFAKPTVKNATSSLWSCGFPFQKALELVLRSVGRYSPIKRSLESCARERQPVIFSSASTRARITPYGWKLVYFTNAFPDPSYPFILLQLRYLPPPNISRPIPKLKHVCASRSKSQLGLNYIGVSIHPYV